MYLHSSTNISPSRLVRRAIRNFFSTPNTKLTASLNMYRREGKIKIGRMAEKRVEFLSRFIWVQTKKTC